MPPILCGLCNAIIFSKHSVEYLVVVNFGFLQAFMAGRSIISIQTEFYTYICDKEISLRFNSRVSGRSYRKGLVCVCVCASVCQLALSWLNRLTYGHDIWYRD